MNILNWFRPQPQKPTVPTAPAVPVKLHYAVEGGQVQVAQADTLEALYAADKYRREAQEVLSATRLAERLLTKDNQAADFDPSPGHVVLPDQKSEYHSTETGYEATLKYSRVKAEGQEVTVKGWTHTTGVWDRDRNTVTLEIPPQVGSSTEQSESYDISTRFQIDAQGKVTLPGASSLAEAEKVAPLREQAKRVQAMLDSAILWHQAAQGFDGQARDFNPAEGKTVVPNVDRKVLADTLAGESVMGKPHLYRGGYETIARTLESFDLQGAADEFIVAGAAHGHNPSGVRFSGRFEDDVVSLSFVNKQGHERESVTWSKTDGTVLYQGLSEY